MRTTLRTAHTVFAVLSAAGHVFGAGVRSADGRCEGAVGSAKLFWPCHAVRHAN
jgi:hypothetical protein